MPAMSRHEGDDPGADTAMFRAYVDQQRETVVPEQQNRTVIVGLVVAIVVLAILALVLIAG